MRYFNTNYSSVLFFALCIGINCNVSTASTIVMDNSNTDNSFGKHNHLTSHQEGLVIPLKPIYHTKALDFREQSLEQADVLLLQQGQYEDIGLASTNIKRVGLTPLISSQETLLTLDIENNGLESNVVPTLCLFKSLQTLNAAQNYFKDADMDIIGKSLVNLQDLNIVHNFITSKGIACLQGLTRLESLDCGFINLGNEGIYNISQIKSLKRVYVRATRFDAEALQYFLTMPNLELIDISQNKINPEALAKFTTSTKAEVIFDHMLN